MRESHAVEVTVLCLDSMCILPYIMNIYYDAYVIRVLFINNWLSTYKNILQNG